MANEVRRGCEEDRGGLAELFRIAFGRAPSAAEDERTRLDPLRCTIIDGPRGEVAAAAHVRPMQQWFGGRAVPLAGYSPVAVAPEFRGQGWATAVTVGQFPDLRDRGEVIAGLFPASLALYRRAGFEIAGSYVSRRFGARDLAGIAPARPLDVRRGSVDDVDAVHRCYAQAASGRDGSIVRDDWWWSHRMPRDLARTYLYVVDDPQRSGEVLGYAVFGHGPGRAPYDYSVHVGEVLAEDPEVTKALWRVVASSGSQAPDVHVIGPAEDDLFLLAPHAEPDVVEREIRWMLRLVDLPAAVAARGWAPWARGRLEVDVVDQAAPWNAGRWTIEVADGRGQARRGGAGTIEASIGGLSCWWSGYASAERLGRTGHLHADAEALSAMGRLIAAVPPVLGDFY